MNHFIAGKRKPVCPGGAGKNSYRMIACVIILTGLYARPLFSDPISITDATKSIPLGKHLELHEDPDAIESIASLCNPGNDARWVKSKAENPALGFTKSAYWARFALKNEERHDLEVYIEQNYILINDMKLFEPDKEGFRITEIGNRKPFYDRPVIYRTLVVPLKIRAGTQETYYLRYLTEGAMNIRPVIWQREAFREKIYNEDIVLWMFYGIMLIMALYNLFLFFSIRDVTYLYLSLHIVVMSLLMMNLHGISFQYLWPNQVWWAVISYPVFMGLTGFAIFQFVRYFLRTMDQDRPLMKYADRSFKILALAGLVMSVLTLVTGNYRIGNLVISAFVVVFAVVGVSIALVLLFTPGPWVRRIKFFVAAFGLYIIGTLMYALKTFTILPDVFLTAYSMQIGTVFEVAILSFALADTIHVMKNDLADLNVHLEDKIRDRTDELRASNEKLKEMDKVKSNFFTNLSHEIKTPLTLISNYMDQYIRIHGSSDEIKVVRRGIDKLLADMVNFFDVLKFERGADLYDHTQVSRLSDILRQKTELFASMVYGKEITISSDIERDLFAKADPLAIERIINNLIENAIRYNRKGGQIHVALKSDDDEISFLVKDTGIGIDRVQLGNIFEPYFQVTHNKRNIQGIGMGLSIVKSIVESLRGTIRVDSEPGTGTTFTVVLEKYRPIEGDVIHSEMLAVRPADTVPHFRELPDVPPVTGARSSVLVVEDNRDLLALMRTRLGERYRVTAALNGREALEKLAGMPPPDVIISDIMMDEMDGYGFIEKITELPGYRDIPFVFVTAKSGSDDRIDGLNRGAIDYIFKPFVMEELISKIDSILRYQDLKKAAFDRDKFMSLGMLLGGISHEIFNPLSGITGPLDNLKRLIDETDLGANERVLRYFRNIHESAEKIEGIVNNIRILYSNKTLEKEPIDVGETARIVVAEHRERNGGRIRFDTDIENAVSIMGNRDAFRQILDNLVANAMESISGTGSISIAAERMDGAARIRVADTGCGIPHEHRDRIFDAFYTTKDVGRGVGLGLNIVKNLAVKMDWDLTVDSEPGKGTVFTIVAKE
ncbi:MAG: response regulator [Spirochaetes bacterium]|nr:MAG: response regulator [Spirochaetota bacterium]